ATVAGRLGLEAAWARKAAPSDPVALELRTELAWALLLQGKPDRAEEHLAVLRSEKTLESRARLMAGLAALQDGRLELAAVELRRAEQEGRYANNLLPVLMLGQVYLALGEYEEALPRLLRVSQAAPALRERAGDESDPLRQLLPGQPTLDLQLLRCHL